MSIPAVIIWKMPLFTPPAEITWYSLLRSSPALAATAKASAIDAAKLIAIMLFTSLSTWPWPGPPTWKMFSQNALSTGSIASKSSGSAPTMVLSRPSSASLGVRASGASIKLHAAGREVGADAARSTPARRWSVSTTISPGARRLEQAVLAVDDVLDLGRAGDADEDDVGGAARIRHCVFASFAPAASRSARLARLRLALKVSGKPLASRFFAMPWPIMPMPMNPMFCCSLRCLSFQKGGAGLSGTPARASSQR